MARFENLQETFPMNKTLIALAATSVFAASAQAQNSVTLYGSVDAGINYVSGQDAAKTRLASGIMEGSRWGFKGNEDLGGGYRALFVLESRFEADTGAISNRAASGIQVPDRFLDLQFLGVPLIPLAPGVTTQTVVNQVGAQLGSQIGVNLTNNVFDRQAFVGLVTPVGAVLAGRQYTPAYEMFYVFDSMQTDSSLSAAQIATLPAAVDIRKSNALAYRLQKDGFTATLMYAFGETGDSTSNNRYMSANAYYKGNGFAVGAAYGTNNNAVGDKALTDVLLGASVDLGPGKLSTLYATFKDDNPGVGADVTAGLIAQNPSPAFAPLATLIGNAFERALRQDSRLFHVGYRFNFGPSTVTVAYNHYDDRTIADADVQSYGAVYTYALSKRTDVNFVLTRFDNDDNAQAAPGGGGFFGGVTSEAGKGAHNIALALRHRF
ncbi:Outer membrane porin protein 32 precursor [Methylibium sp. T29]|uniref:Putative outer membrane protein (Porin) n=2 Tax=Sphaerotilaceae TaxID=2975441 RepID=A2SKG9_METPP|nr:putative outer membrane protein (porin) [Methylibium petroleiphilum PM1]EWS57092.1 Outer membrane porin protein 32 precursor [Methylibium sp. T29]EWS60579.1 Outer membrane porin protein 32 precursor [Methylibium sp. T29-B]